MAESIVGPRGLESVLRYVLALALIVFGSNLFLHFFTPPHPEGAAADYLRALGRVGNIYPAIGAVFLLSALLLATRRTVLALLLLAPLLYNILGYHLHYDEAGITAGAALAVLWLMLAAQNSRGLLKLLDASSEPPKKKS